MFNPYETQQIEEFIPSEFNEYEDYMDHFRVNVMSTITTECIKCGEFITDFELNVNDGICPCCGARIDKENDIPI